VSFSKAGWRRCEPETRRMLLVKASKTGGGTIYDAVDVRADTARVKRVPSASSRFLGCQDPMGGSHPNPRLPRGLALPPMRTNWP